LGSTGALAIGLALIRNTAGGVALFGCIPLVKNAVAPAMLGWDEYGW
jgi:hypothetical protein